VPALWTSLQTSVDAPRRKAWHARHRTLTKTFEKRVRTLFDRGFTDRPLTRIEPCIFRPRF